MRSRRSLRWVELLPKETIFNLGDFETSWQIYLYIKILSQEHNTMNKPYFNAKPFFIILPVFLIFSFSINSSAYEYGSEIPQVNETPFAKTTATPHRIPGNMRFRHEMAELLGKRSDLTIQAMSITQAGLQAIIPAQKNSFQERESSGNSIDFCL